MSRHTRKNQRKRSRKQPEDEDEDDLSRLKPEETADLNVSFPVFNVPEWELTVSFSTSVLQPWPRGLW